MITKEKFVKVIEHIKQHNELEGNLCSALEAMSPENYCCAFVYSKYETLAIDLLKEALGLDEEIDWIEYFIYELEFGTKFQLGCVVEADGKAVDLSTPEALYDYLMEYYLCK